MSAALGSKQIEGEDIEKYLVSETDIRSRLIRQQKRREALADPALYYANRNLLLTKGEEAAAEFGKKVVEQLRQKAGLSIRDVKKIATAATNAVFDIWEEVVNDIYPETSEMTGKLQLGNIAAGVSADAGTASKSVDTKLGLP